MSDERMIDEYWAGLPRSRVGRVAFRERFAAEHELTHAGLANMLYRHCGSVSKCSYHPRHGAPDPPVELRLTSKRTTTRSTSIDPHFRRQMNYFDDTAQVYRMLKLGDNGVSLSMFTQALKGNPVTPNVARLIGNAWERWATRYLKHGLEETFDD